MSTNNAVGVIERAEQIYDDFRNYVSTMQSKVDTAKMFALVIVLLLTFVENEGVSIARAIGLFVSIVVLLIGIFNIHHLVAIETTLLATAIVMGIYYNAIPVVQIAILAYVFIGAGVAAVQVRNETNLIFLYVSIASLLVGMGTSVPMLGGVAKFAMLFVCVVMIFISAFTITGQIFFTEGLSAIVILVAAYIDRFDVVVVLSLFLTLYNLGKILGKKYK